MNHHKAFSFTLSTEEEEEEEEGGGGEKGEEEEKVYMCLIMPLHVQVYLPCRTH